MRLWSGRTRRCTLSRSPLTRPHMTPCWSGRHCTRAWTPESKIDMWLHVCVCDVRVTVVRWGRMALKMRMLTVELQTQTKQFTLHFWQQYLVLTLLFKILLFYTCVKQAMILTGQYKVAVVPVKRALTCLVLWSWLAMRRGGRLAERLTRLSKMPTLPFCYCVTHAYET